MTTKDKHQPSCPRCKTPIANYKKITFYKKYKCANCKEHYFAIPPSEAYSFSLKS
jgi:transposase-like protein